ncbi:RNA-binding ribosome biosynthesis protein mak21 [Microsporum canis]|uniref:CCAAT-box-binding transcription factor n=1 Tax=Arthroderma otae (strain ATCC MYA-4605 / CBS 113480) TaxID=554155 RepID=C5FHN2_ARTOC|nr:CCAAT-box-binding transcription factor [Microsporum canis CBS 113480]EEQ28772.1 CCAAT-box-binding transcription factor [Microsporum canis CBS 113480]
MKKEKEKGEKSPKDKDAAVAEKTRSNSNADAAPSFSDAMVANLTKRIEQRLKGDESGNKALSKVDKKQKPEKNEKRKGREMDNEVKHTDKPAKKREPIADINATDKAGKKRDRSGKIIKPQVAEKPYSPEKKQGADGKSWEEEVYAIGGTKEDLDLVAGAESDSEMEDKEISSGDLERLRRDLGRLINGENELPDIEDTPAQGETKSAKTKQGKKQDKKPSGERLLEKPIQEEKSPGNAVSENTPVKRESKKVQKKDATISGTTASTLEAKVPKRSSSSSSNLIIPDRSDWYATPLPDISYDSSRPINVSRQILERVREYAMTLLEAENKAYASNRDSKSSSYKFYSTIVSSGTLSDKISALTLSAQESPLHNTQALENLVGLAKKRSRAQAVEVLRSLKDMFAQGTLLPSDRRLKYFVNQPALAAALAESGGNWDVGDKLPNQIEKSHLIMWAFEDFVKDQYFEVLKVLEVWCNDEIEFSRSRALSYVYELLKEKPEQESNLLRLLINKLGDPSKKIASRASYLLLQLEQAHPLMKGTIVSAIESESLFRPGQSQHAKYYGVITLNQTILSKGDDKVASQLLDIYFPLFVALLKSKKETHTQGKHEKDKHSKKGKKGKGGNDAAKGEAQDEELREKLISAVLVGVNRAYPFTTSSFELLSKHLDTLFRITNSSNFNTSIQALMLIQQLSSSHAVSADRFYKTLYESLLDPRVATSSKQSMYLNLLYKALNTDVNIKRIKAFVKRLVQILGVHNPSFSCGVLYLIKQLESTFPSLTAMVDQPEDAEDDDEEEVFMDVPDDGEEEMEVDKEEAKAKFSATRYDPRKRDPEQSNADRSCLWELLPYLSHYHPSVAVSAKQLLTHEKMSGKPDLTIHTLTHFLDRFVYKTPKATPSLRGSSIMQPLAGGDSSGLLVTSGRNAAQQPVNSESFWRKQSDEVAAEDVFFHDYFNRLGKDKLRQKSKKKASKGDDEEGESDEESEVWKALVQSQPELDGEGISDDDMDMDDFESAMDASDDDLEGMDGDMDGDREIDDDVIINEESSGEEEAVSEAEVDKSIDMDDDMFNIDQSDEEAFLDSDAELPSDLDMETEFKDTEKKSESKREKRRKLKHLPTFASVEDYAALLGKDDDEGF